jgi:dipeptidyl aminopeptidase/acylaminoacyl peptidase/predicted Ser/Thr protein kinase
VSDAPRNLGPYRLVEKLGEGGMGVVWKAVDTTLDREVAVKILPDALNQHPDRLVRFEREAKVLAALQHPNIAMIHGLHREDGERFLVMELVEGNDLSQQLQAGPMPTVDALKVCSQVARALQAAHDRNIVHRDLKPANIMLSPSGEAKVLDFGLAKVLDPDSRETTEVTSMPTVTTGGTRVGTILGTAAYMSPEQARGKPTDRRTDIWSFGCVLYECLTGVSEFRGDTMSDSIGAILHKTPDWSALPDDLPANVRWVLRRCLTKDRDNRLHDIADARIEIEQAIVDPEAASEIAGTAPAPEAATHRPWLLPMVAALTALVVGAAAWMLKPAPADAAPTVGLSVQLPNPQEDLRFDLSPQGTALVYREVDDSERQDASDIPVSRLWLRRLDSFVPVPIAGTEGADLPVFSPDGTMIAFVVKRDGGRLHQADLRVVGLDGRPPLTVAANAVDHGSAKWLSNDTLVFVDDANEGLLQTVSRSGGEPRTFAEFEADSVFSTFAWQPWDDGRWILTISFIEGTSSVVMIEAATGKETILIRDAHRGARLLADGTLLFIRDGALLAARIETSGSEARIAGETRTIMTAGADPEDRVQQMVPSEAGHLAFVTGEWSGNNRQLMTLDRDGNVEPLINARGPYVAAVDFSEDGRLLSVIHDRDETVAELWVVELDTGARRPMAPDEPVACGGNWLPDNRLAFTVWRGIDQGRIAIREMRRGAEPETPFDNWPAGLKLGDCRLGFDGVNLAFAAGGQGFGGSGVAVEGGEMDIWIQPLDGSAPPRTLISTPAYESDAVFSPDNRWLAYTSNESGRNEVYVRRHSVDGGVAGRSIQVSRRGGRAPLWSADGDEIYFSWGDRFLGVTFEAGDRPRISEPFVIVEDSEALRVPTLFAEPKFIPMPDGERFAFVQTVGETPEVERIEVVLNWEAGMDGVRD